MRLIFSLLLLAGLAGGAAQADTLTLRGNANVPPKSWLEGDQPKGYAMDAAKAVLEKAGFTVTMEMGPFAKMMEAALDQGGVVTGVFHTADRAQKYHFSEPMVDDLVLVVVRRGREFPLNSAADLAGKRVGFQQGARFGQEFEDALPKLTAVTDNDPKQRLQRLMDGEVDAIIMNPGLGAVARNAAAVGIPMKELSALPTPIAMLPNHLVMARTPENAATMARIDEAIRTLRSDGTLARIQAGYDE